MPDSAPQNLAQINALTIELDDAQFNITKAYAFAVANGADATFYAELGVMQQRIADTRNQLKVMKAYYSLPI